MKHSRMIMFLKAALLVSLRVRFRGGQDLRAGKAKKGKILDENNVTS